MAPPTVAPETFARAVSALKAEVPRPEITLEEVGAPQRLAPYAYALAGTVLRRGSAGRAGSAPAADPDDDDEVASGRLILLHDPAGHDAWDGTMRLVTYVTAELEPELAADALLPAVGWSWLIDALESEAATYAAIGGTVTQTMSTRFGDLAGPPATADIEIRASWTPLDLELERHLRAWCALLALTAGLPPPGITALAERRAPVST